MLYPDTVQAPINLTRVPRPQWRDVPHVGWSDYPYLVRLMIYDEANERLIVIGSGAAIGLYKDDWLIVASARHVFENLEKDLGRDHRPSWLPMLATPREKLEESFNPKLRRLLCCGVCSEELQREYICTAFYTIPVDGTSRDTALVFVRLHQDLRGKVQLIPVDVTPPPNPDYPVLLGGFTDDVRDPHTMPGPPPVTVGQRWPKIREGYAGAFGPRPGAPVKTNLIQVLIPIAPRMSGGALIIHRPGLIYPKTVPVLVGTINGELQTIRDKAAERPEVPGDGYCSPAIALWTHEVLLPENRWIWFYEAVAQGIIRTHRAGALHVRVVDRNVMVDFTDTGELPTAKAFGWKTEE